MFNDGRAHGYALGLMVGTYKGLRQVDHSGSTAGYRAHLARYPDQHLSVAVLCNVTSGNATQAARAVAGVYLGDRAKMPATAQPTDALSAADLDQTAGLYRHTITGVPLTIARDADRLRAERGLSDGLNPERGQLLVPTARLSFVAATGQKWQFDGRGGARVTDQYGTVDSYQRVEPARLTSDQLKELAGTYVSDEAESSLTVAMNGDSLVIRRRPDTTLKLTPIYADAFNAPSLGLVIFRRDAGRVTALSVVQDRVWDLRFARRPQSAATSHSGQE
jgi:hypothetical protein